MNRISVWNPWSMISPWEWDDEDFPQNLPPMNIVDKGDTLEVKIQIPGFDKENVKITVENTKLVVSGEVKKETKEENKQEKFFRHEIQNRSFSRSCSLPTEVDSEKAKATFKNGELIVELPKVAKVKPREINIIE
ncbi:Hsp20/alpha crystallin family protein [Candidatus Dojkabacteria bacterium]|nr:Hsp20/alpha crystallin family protein [Candidatus Dojkabacteria bacterium]